MTHHLLLSHPRRDPMTAPAPFVVRIRARSCTWSSAAMERDAAESLRAAVLRDLSQLGLGDGFFRFTASGGREVDIRAHYVVGVECEPWTEKLAERMSDERQRAGVR